MPESASARLDCLADPLKSAGRTGCGLCLAAIAAERFEFGVVNLGEHFGAAEIESDPVLFLTPFAHSQPPVLRIADSSNETSTSGRFMAWWEQRISHDDRLSCIMECGSLS